MNKYDFGYELFPESTNEWAFHHISPNSVVLELGPSNGNLIYHLTKEKNCTADIVEIDADAGTQASVFARISCIGSVEGNIERTEWIAKLAGNRYDYIVILDVLEHVRNPLEVLAQVKELLREDGKILLSIPNIAHNSILINLLQNKFQYTSVGLLDDTHIHFYTYESARQLLHDVGLVTVKEEVKQIAVGNNEVRAAYGTLPGSVEAFLKTRPLGTAYQFLFTIQKGDTQPDVQLEYIPDRNYELIVFRDNAILNRIAINPSEDVSVDISLDEPLDTLRIDPLDRNCIITDWKVKGFACSSEEVALESVQCSGSNLFDGEMAFFDDNPQVYLRWKSKISRLSIKYRFDIYDDDGIRKLGKYMIPLENAKKKLQQCNAYMSEHKLKSIVKIIANRSLVNMGEECEQR